MTMKTMIMTTNGMIRTITFQECLLDSDDNDYDDKEYDYDVEQDDYDDYDLEEHVSGEPQLQQKKTELSSFYGDNDYDGKDYDYD